jgi:nucleotide-binding universal stress UspA family protein
MKILIGVDGSETALRAVRFAARLTGGLAERTCTLLYVRPSHTGAVVSLGAPDPLLESRLEQEVEDAEREVLREAGAVLQADGLPAAELVETGPPGPAIVRVAAEGGFDLIVLGNRGHGELKSLLVGSTSDAVLHNAPCSVLVVR